jgi:hypothetical protein
MRRHLFAVLLLSAAACRGPGRPDTKPPHPAVAGAPVLTLVATATVPAREIVGVVLDRETAQPVEGAQVFVRVGSATRSEPATAAGAVSDAAGRFRIEGVPAGRGVLVARRIGYGSAERALTLSPDSGYAGVVVLSAAEVVICADPVGPPGAVGVVVRDVVTGLGPPGGATLTVRDGAFRDSATAPPEQPGSGLPGSALGLVLEAAPMRVGVYEVTVTSHGYRTWRASGVRAFRDPRQCNNFVPASLPVWLLPEH